VRPGEARIDLRLESGDDLNTLLDDPGTMAAILRKRAVVPTQPVPRTPDGKPDLSGVWLTNEDPYPEQPSALPWAVALAKERAENHRRDHPHNRCLPGGTPVPAATPPFLAKFVQTPSLLVILFEDAGGFRQVFLDGRSHPADPNATWLGHSIGKWEGETLVVDTVGFNDQGWTGIFPRTEMLRIIERYRRPDFGHLEIKVTIEDPGVFTKPWDMNLTWDLLPKEEVLEYVCEKKP
jgi:hypothetical protein